MSLRGNNPSRVVLAWTAVVVQLAPSQCRLAPDLSCYLVPEQAQPTRRSRPSGASFEERFRPCSGIFRDQIHKMLDAFFELPVAAW